MMFFIVMFLFYYNYVLCAFFNYFYAAGYLIDRPILHSIYLIVNNFVHLIEFSELSI